MSDTLRECPKCGNKTIFYEGGLDFEGKITGCFKLPAKCNRTSCKQQYLVCFYKDYTFKKIVLPKKGELVEL